MKRILTIALGLLMFAIPMIAFADSGVNVSVNVAREEIHVGDVIPLMVTVNHPKGWRVMFPMLEKKWGELEVRAQNPQKISDNADGSETTTQEIDVMYFRPAQVTTPAMQVNVVDTQGNVQELNVEPMVLNVKSVLHENDTTLRDIKPQAELWQLSSSPIPFVASLALAFTVLGSASVWAWKHRPFVDKRTPRERALDELRALEAEQLDLTNVKLYCVRVSDTLREYLARGCNINANDLTTRELAQTLQEKNVPTNIAAQIINVLRVCDNVKFANDVSDAMAIKTLTSIAQQIILLYPPAPETKKRGVKK